MSGEDKKKENTLIGDGSKRQNNIVPLQARSKRSYTRTKTGCIVCRARRIKCDERRPVCLRCETNRAVCQYSLPLPTSSIKPVISRHKLDNVVFDDDDSNHYQRQIKWSPRYKASAGIEPSDWEFHESVRYYFQVVQPSIPAESRQVSMADLKNELFPRHLFYAGCIGDQLERASKARGRILRPDEDPAFAVCWAGYHRSVLFNIDEANQLLRDDAKFTDQAPATLAILQLLLTDLKAALSLWPAHLRGFLAYVKHRGGAAKIMTLPKPEKSRLSPILSFTMQMNTTCPANKQIKGSDDFTDDEIKTLIKFDPSRVEPCPIDYHLARVRITRLRRILAQESISIRPQNTNVVLSVQHIFDTICQSDVENWVNEMFGDKDEELQRQARVMAPIYALAIRLYGILTLPPSAVAAWAVSSSEIRDSYTVLPGRTVYDSLRITHRDVLLEMIREQWDKVRLKQWLAWPLTVIGVALAGDDATWKKAYVAKSLLAIWKTPIVSNASITGLEKLRVFWLSGKTAWDDCFDEPTPAAV